MSTVVVPSTETDLQLCCVPLTSGVLDEASAERLARVFKALGDPNRVRLLSIVAASVGGEACVCDLTEPLKLSQPTVSHHMKQLVDAGVMRREQRGRWAYYSIVDGSLDSIARAILPRQ